MRKAWPIKRLGEVCEFRGGGTPSKAIDEYWHGDIPWVSPKDMKFDIVFDSIDHISQDAIEGSATSLIPKNSVLIVVRSGILARTIPIAIAGRDLTINQDLKALCPSQSVAPRFLYYFLQSKTDVLLAMVSQGATVHRLSTDQIRSLEFALPPPAEQQRIVGILDRTFEATALAKANTEKNLQNARAIFEGHLQSVFSRNGRSWPIKKLGDLSEQITDGTHISPPYVESGVAMLDSKHIQDDFSIDDTEPEKFISRTTDTMLAKRCKPRTGDILISSRGSIGKIAIVREGQDFNIMGNMILIRLPASVSRSFAAFYLRSQVGHLESISRGVAQKGLYLNQVRDYDLPLPPEAKQAEIGKQLGALATDTQRLANLYAGKLVALNSLTRSLLHQAFSGEL